MVQVSSRPTATIAKKSSLRNLETAASTIARNVFSPICQTLPFRPTFNCLVIGTSSYAVC